MNRYAQQIPPRWWGPKLSPAWIRFWRPFRKRQQVRTQQLMQVEVRDLAHLRAAVDSGQGVMITPNHSGHADPYIMYHVADEVDRPLYFLTAWQVFQQRTVIGQRILQHHGCFSIDREGTDLKAFRRATDVLEQARFPLVIFPEGEVYHTNDRVTPFREGAAAIAVAAARRAKKPMVCVPCAIKYRYIDDPTPNLLQLMDRLEQEIFWRPRPDLPLAERIYRFAEGAMALKELEYVGRTSAGALRDRIDALARHVLGCIEARYEIDGSPLSIPERVKQLRSAAVKKLADMPPDAPARRPFEHDLDDLFLVVQLYSYPGDYVAERPSIERMAETLDKFEEDVLGVFSASIRGRRRAIVSFGPAIEVAGERKSKGDVPELTRALEAAVQQQLDAIRLAESRQL
ncbi:MAG: 1-acyl-sn-glycerol-3-phosphate acyltransferase [Pirellulales bacterium]